MPTFSEAETFGELTDNQLISEYKRLFAKDEIDGPEYQDMLGIALELRERGYRIEDDVRIEPEKATTWAELRGHPMPPEPGNLPEDDEGEGGTA